MDVRVKIEFQKSFNDMKTIEEIREYVYNNVIGAKGLDIYRDEIKIQYVWEKDKRWR